MSIYKATVIETGNSYALRVPKDYVKNAHLQKGDKVSLPAPLSGSAYNAGGFWRAAERLAQSPDRGRRGFGAMSVEEVMEWQRETRKDRPLPGRD